MHTCSRRSLLQYTVTLTSLLSSTVAQTYTSCNPLYQSCPANAALGKSVTIDFTNGASNSFTASGAPSYGSNGAAFTVAKSGDSPTITSKWYLMFGHVDFVVKAAPGVGIVSSTVLQSDCLDEIDWEWLGGDDTQVQSNYFGKGQTASYNRGAFHSAPGNHDGFHTYSIDWTADNIVWSIDGQTIRVQSAADAPAGQYPQTPMLIKVGAWSGGDPSNSAGTVQWAGGYTDYSAGPYTMYLKSISATDYSTGTSYTYSGSSGTWQSIQSSGGKINSSGSGKSNPTTENAPAITSSTQSQQPSSSSQASSQASSSASQSSSSAPETIAQGSNVISTITTTGWDDRGFATTKTLVQTVSAAPAVIAKAQDSTTLLTLTTSTTSFSTAAESTTSSMMTTSSTNSRSTLSGTNTISTTTVSTGTSSSRVSSAASTATSSAPVAVNAASDAKVARSLMVATLISTIMVSVWWL